MPLDQSLRDQIHQYCISDLPGLLEWHIDKFAFIADNELRLRLGRAYYTARYLYKVMEALAVTGEERHPFVKFQIMQYASIYEAVISYLLWSKYKDHPEVKALETHKAYKPVPALGSKTQAQYDGEQLFMCVYRDAKTPRNSIPFHDKVDCAVRIGFVEECYAEDIKLTFKLRNLAHIEAEAEKQVDVEIAQSKLAYWRMQPFLDHIADVLATEAA